MSRSISDVATGPAGISADVLTVAGTAQTTSSRVHVLRDAVTDLAATSTDLRTLVSRFQY